MYCIDENMYKKIIGVDTLNLQERCEHCQKVIVDCRGRVLCDSYGIVVRTALGKRRLKVCDTCANDLAECTLDRKVYLKKNYK